MGGDCRVKKQVQAVATNAEVVQAQQIAQENMSIAANHAKQALIAVSQAQAIEVKEKKNWE